MNCEIGPKIVGCKVAVETVAYGQIEGVVHNVNPSGNKVFLRNGVVSSSGVELPSPYLLFVKDIESSKYICVLLCLYV